jgi:predicted permease
MESLVQDVRYAVRGLRRSPGFALVAVLTLALGVGASTAMFSIVDAVLLRSLPHPDADRLVKLVFNNPGVGLHDVPFSSPEFEDLKSRAGVFDQVSVVFPASTNLTGAKEPQRLELLGVSPNYFSMLGASPQIGRLFGPEDEARGFSQTAVISDGLWRRAFGADPHVIGRNLQLDNDPYTIVGVLPPGFRHPGRTVAGDVEVWAAAGFSADPFPPGRGTRLLPGAIGRLARGLTRAQAQSKLDAFAAGLRSDYPNDYPAASGWSIELQPLQESLVGNVRPMLLVLMGAVVLIVLIACVNIANLLLARAAGREREMAVRLALGASRWRMVRQMLTESLILSLLAGTAGVLTATGALRFLLQFVPSRIPRLQEVGVNWTVLGFALLVSLLAGVLFGLAPAMHSTRSDLFIAIREGTRGAGHSAKTSRLRSSLIVSEVALAVVLMVGAGLLLRTLWGLLEENPGFNPSRVVTASVWLPVPNDPKVDFYAALPRYVAFVRESLQRVKAIPGVESAGMTSSLPASSGSTFSTALTIEDRPAESLQDLRAEVIRVSPDYFRVMQAPLARGRFFDESDDASKDGVAIIDETTAHRYWPGQDPIGKRLRLGRAAALPWITVAGQIRDIKHDGLDADGVPHVYVSMYQRAGRVVSVVVRTALPAASLEPQIRGAIQSVDPNLPVFDVRQMEEVIDASLAPRRFSAELIGLFAALALALAAIGIYGLLAYLAGQRSQEIGIRMALGAGPSDILKLIVGKGASLAAVGIGTGLLLAAGAAPLVKSLLYGVLPLDPGVYIAAPLLLLVVALAASYLPARRAARVDPLVALREG